MSRLVSFLQDDLKEGSGGILGQVLVPAGSEIFGVLGLSIISIAGLLLSIQAVTGFSWVVIAEEIGRSFFWALDRGRRVREEKFDPLRDKWMERLRQRKTTELVLGFFLDQKHLKLCVCNAEPNCPPTTEER
mgnify:CR=1 FL=1